MTILLVILGLILGGVGLLFLSSATAGVGIICLGCIVMVWARIVQAYEQERYRRGLPPPAARTDAPTA